MKHCLLDMTCGHYIHELIRPVQNQFSQYPSMDREYAHGARPLSE